MVYLNPDISQSSSYVLNSLLFGLGPLLGGLILIYIFKRPNGLTILNEGTIQTSIALIIPIVLFSVLGWFYGISSFFTLKIILVAIVYAVFEEYGWRGYLQSELIGINRVLKYFIISVLWFFWHLEFEYTVLAYVIILCGSVGMGYVADKSKSLVYVSLFHALLNILLTPELNFIPFYQKLISVVISVVSIIVLMKFYANKPVKNS